MKTEKKETLRGSALFTVVAVMAILILFLTGTLALATASNSRAHKSYSISQASYTARSAIRSFKAAMEDPTNGEGIVAAVQAIGTGSVQKLYPEIDYGDHTMGNIGYWDETTGDWVDDHLKLEAMPDMIDWVYNDTEDKWIPYNVVRLTATCRLGREEETVQAYISKNVTITEEEEPVSDSEVKGLQEAGGNTYGNGGDIYGGLGIALADDPSDGVGEYLLNNAFQTYTTLNFINASVNVRTSSFGIHVEKSNNTPVSGNVIMGNVSLYNNAFVTLEDSYEMKKNFKQKDIPYLYVDNLMYDRVDTDTPFVQPAGGYDSTKFQPFNIYAGTMYFSQQFKARSDVYLMDEPVTNADGKRVMYTAPEAKFVDREYWPENRTNTWPTEYTVGGERAIPKGENYFGVDINGKIAQTSVSARSLYKWATSTFKRTDSYDSYGGNIYCNGNFHMGGAIINGNLRVKGDFILENVTNAYKPQINGDLVVEGNIIDNSSELDVDDIVAAGHLIYNDGLASAGSKITVTVKSDYELVTDQLYPGYTEIESVKLDNRKLSADDSEVQVTADGKYLVLIPTSDPDNKIFDSEPYVLHVPLDGTSSGYSNPAIITTDASTRYVVDKDGKFVFEGEDEDKTPVKTKDEYLYYDGEGNGPLAKEDAKGDYYRTKTEPYRKVDPSEALNITAGSSNAVPYNQYIYGKAYPENMTREKIYGEYKDGKLVSDPATKLVTTLEEARKALSWSSKDGAFDKTVYPFEEPSGVPADHIISGTKDGATIDIVRPDSGYEWYILDNLKMVNGGSILVHDAPGSTPSGNKKYGGGVVRFFIKGDLEFNSNCRICLADMPDTINYTDDYGIEYYGMAEETDSGIVGKSRIVSNNYTLLVGSIKAPYMTMDVTQGDGPDTFTYKTESGRTVTGYKPVIIGNALIDHLTKATNNFYLAYTKSGTGSSSVGGDTEDVAHTVSGDYRFTYVVG